MGQVIRRHAARAILLTPQDEVLLLRVKVRDQHIWITPGGGIEAGETPQQALQRELTEELGLMQAEIGPLLWQRQHTTTLYHRRWCQSEDYFLVPCDRFVPHMLDRNEARLVQELRWWHLDEIAETEEQITPLLLVQIVATYLIHGAPDPIPPVEVVDD